MPGDPYTDSEKDPSAVVLGVSHRAGSPQRALHEVRETRVEEDNPQARGEEARRQEEAQEPLGEPHRRAAARADQRDSEGEGAAAEGVAGRIALLPLRGRQREVDGPREWE